MLLAVPVLRRYDLLERLIASAEVSHELNGYLIVDNGGEFRSKLEGSETIQRALARSADIRVLEPGSNIGVAAAWNAILDEAGDEPVLISNDDVELGRETISVLSAKHEELPDALLLADDGPDASGWCLFFHPQSLYKKIGPYDESFHPAYYEDSDYRWRMKLEKREPVLVKTEFKHAVRGSWSDESRKIMGRSLEQFERKWGGNPRGDESALFTEPFDGAPIAYALRKRTYRGAWRRLARRIYRWDVINAALSFADAFDKKYLEIGVGSGETMRQVKASRKVGVDPSPAPEGAASADIFFKMTSDAFFDRDDGDDDAYGVAFIDGLHHAEQVYRDIENACNAAMVVVVHDANPSSREMQEVPQRRGEWTGDVWKAIARVRREGKHAVRTVDANYGVAVIVPNIAVPSVDLPAETYDDLTRHRQELLGLVTFDECVAWLGSFFRTR